MEMRDEVLSSLGSQDMEAMPDRDDDEFYCEDDQLDVEVVLRPGIDTLFSLSAFNNFEMGSMAENPILIDEQQEKRNSAPKTPISERLTQTLC